MDEQEKGETAMTWNWSENLNNVINHKKTGSCPFCNSDNTNYVYQRFISDKGTFVVWCDDCNSLGFQTRLRIPRGAKTTDPENFDSKYTIKNEKNEKTKK